MHELLNYKLMFFLSFFYFWRSVIFSPIYFILRELQIDLTTVVDTNMFLKHLLRASGMDTHKKA